MKTVLVYRRASGALVKIDHVAVTAMRAYRQSRWWRTEAGGVLLGRYIRDSPDVVVDEVTLPMRGDRRRRTSFRRSAKGHQKIIDQRWQTSEGTCQYLGEWHTHPEPDPTPSLIDTEDWQRRLHADQFDGDSLLFVIVGTTIVAVWEGMQVSGELLRLEAVLDRVDPK